MVETNTLLEEILEILKKDPSRLVSREEILNSLASRKKDREIEQLLAELEVSSSGKDDGRSDVYATCGGGTVYYRWNRV